MSRPLRIQYPGAVYHITCRGNERKEIFKDDLDRRTFLKVLSQSARTYNIKIMSYVLMDNHFHLLVETPRGNLGEFMRHFNITYTSHYNRRHNRVGHLYQGRYKSILVDKAPYLSLLSRYIHLNPVRIKGLQERTEEEKMQYLMSYLWSSLPGYLEVSKREGFIDYLMVLEEYGGDNEEGRLGYKNVIYADISKGIEIKKEIIGQSILGGEEFVGWVRGNFLKDERDGECPPLREIQSYRAKEDVMKVVAEEIGKDIGEIRAEKGVIRQILMELLYRVGGLTGVEIGEILGVHYSAVSQGRKCLREKIQKDKEIEELLNRIEEKLSTIKN